MTQESTQKRRKNTSKTTRMIVTLLFGTFIAAVANGFTVSNLLGSTPECANNSDCPDAQVCFSTENIRGERQHFCY